MHKESHQNLLRLRRVDYIYESKVKAIKIYFILGGLSTIENAQSIL